MKQFFTAFAIVIMIATTSCQEKKDKKDKDQVPAVVMKSFKEKYPNENDPDFKTDSHGYWEAHFKKKGEKYRADFNADGSWIETENSIKYSALPKVIREKIKIIYAAYEISEVEHVMSLEKGEFYDVEFKQKGKNKDVEFKPDGSIINSQL